MKYVGKMSTKVEVYQIFLEHGHGTMESQHSDGEVVKTLKCSEVDAWIIAESLNIEEYGVMHKRSSWETPMHRYRKLEIS